MTALLQDDTELFKQFSDNESFSAVADRHDLLDHLRGPVGGAGARASELVDEGGARTPVEMGVIMWDLDSGRTENLR